MAEHPQIIELFGLPGCGKSTLCDISIETKPSEIWCLSDLSREYKDLSFMTKLVNIPIRLILYTILFFLKMPLLTRREWVIYNNFIKLILLYNTPLTKQILVLVDHGITQDVIGMLYGHKTSIPQPAIRALSRLVSIMDNVSFIYCQIDPNVSKERIRNRNRQNIGRLDIIRDDDELISALEIENDIFEELSSAIVCASTLNMMNTKEELREHLRYIVKGL